MPPLPSVDLSLVSHVHTVPSLQPVDQYWENPDICVLPEYADAPTCGELRVRPKSLTGPGVTRSTSQPRMQTMVYWPDHIAVVGQAWALKRVGSMDPWHR